MQISVSHDDSELVALVAAGLYSLIAVGTLLLRSEIWAGVAILDGGDNNNDHNNDIVDDGYFNTTMVHSAAVVLFAHSKVVKVGVAIVGFAVSPVHLKTDMMGCWVLPFPLAVEIAPLVLSDVTVNFGTMTLFVGIFVDHGGIDTVNVHCTIDSSLQSAKGVTVTVGTDVGETLYGDVGLILASVLTNQIPTGPDSCVPVNFSATITNATLVVKNVESVLNGGKVIVASSSIVGIVGDDDVNSKRCGDNVVIAVSPVGN